MRKLLAIKVQSLIDLITNSSSELFQLRTDQTVEQVSEVLKKITSGYCEPVLFDLKRYRENKDKLQEMLDAIHPSKDASDEEWDEYWRKSDQIKADNPDYFVMDTIDGWFFDPENPESAFEVYKDYLCCQNDWDKESLDPMQEEFRQFVTDNDYLENKDQWNPFTEWNIKEEALKKFIASHKMPNPHDCAKYSYYYGSVEQLDGCILVLSEYDNSIPYETWDTINALFNGTNYHLGRNDSLYDLLITTFGDKNVSVSY